MYKLINRKFNRVFSICLLCTVSVNAQKITYRDTSFLQEYHEAFPVSTDAKEKDVRSIAADNAGNIWIATAGGVLVKNKNDSSWTSPFTATEKGPAFAVVADSEGAVWMGTWNGVYVFKNNTLQLLKGTDGPVAVMCIAKEGVYAAGPKGIWLCNGTSVEKKNYAIARSLRKIISDNNNGIWIASDVGLYHCTTTGTKHFVDTSFLLSAYVKGLALAADNTLWAGGLGGVSILNKDKKKQGTYTKRWLPFHLYQLHQ